MSHYFDIIGSSERIQWPVRRLIFWTYMPKKRRNPTMNLKPDDQKNKSSEEEAQAHIMDFIRNLTIQLIGNTVDNFLTFSAK